MTVDNTLYAPIRAPQIQVDNINLNTRRAQCFRLVHDFTLSTPPEPNENEGVTLSTPPEPNENEGVTLSPPHTERVRRLAIPLIELQLSYLHPEFLIRAAAGAAGFDLSRPWRRRNDLVLGCLVLEQSA